MFKVAIITSSDSGYAGEREDKSGPVIKRIVEDNGYEVFSLKFNYSVLLCIYSEYKKIILHKYLF